MPHGARDVAADGADPARGQRRGAEREPRRSGRAGPSVRRQGRHSLPRRPRPRRCRVRPLPREFPAVDPQTRARVGYLPESLSLHTYYRGADLLQFYGALLEMPLTLRTERAASLLRRLGLEDVATRRVSTYSKGTLQRLGFVQALLNDPDLLILDEPTSSLDPLARRRFSEILRELKARRKTILVSSHLLSEVEAICGRVAILKDGAVARSGALVDLLATPSVRMHVGRLSPALVEELIAVGAEVAIAGSNTTVRCPDDAVRAGVVAALEARGVPIERTDTECRSLEELFVETVAA